MKRAIMQVMIAENSNTTRPTEQTWDRPTAGEVFKRELRYSPATDYLRYDGLCWQETQPGAQAIAHALTDRQLKEAEAAITQATQHMMETGAQGLIETFGKTKAEAKMNAEQREAYAELQQAESYRNYALKRRESKNITSTLRKHTRYWR